MKSVYALIPAALLAGTVLSAPVEAKRTEDPSVHAERLSSKQKYFKTMAAKKPGKINRVGEVRTRKAKTGTVSEVRKAASEPRKAAASLKPRKVAAGRKRKLSTVAALKQVETKTHRPVTVVAPKQLEIKTRKPVTVAVPKQLEIKTRKPRTVAALKQVETKARKPITLAQPKGTETKSPFDMMSMTKTLRSGPRVVRKLGDGKAKSLAQEELRIDGQRDIEVTQVIREMAPSYGVPTWFALRIANVESGYNPYARGRAGEIGIYQLKCQTARGMGFEGDCSGLTDVRTNVRWGLKHLSLAIASSGGNLRLAASKHNAGLGRKSLVHSYIAKVF